MRRGEAPRAAAPEQPFPWQQNLGTSRRSAYEVGLPKLTLGTCFASAGAWKNGYSLKPNIFAVRFDGNCAARRVVRLNGFVVAHPLDRDAIFGAGELVHQPVELLVRLQLRIVLDDGEEPAECRRLLVRRGNRFLGRLRREQARARVGDVLVDRLFVLREPLGRLDQVGNEIVAPLQLVLDLRPLRLDRLFLADERVVRAAGQRQLPRPARPSASELCA